MKRYALLLGVLVAGLGYAGDVVNSVNVVGFTKFQVPGGGQYAQVGIQFDAEDSTLMGVFGTNQLRAATKAGNADKVYVWNTSGTPGYKTYALKSSTMMFHDTGDWGGAPTNPLLTAGQALWIQSPVASTKPLDVTVRGDVVSVVTQKMNMVSGFQMIAYPFSSSVKLQDMDFLQGGATAASKAGNADKIYVWKDGGYQMYGLKSTDGKWHSINDWGGAPADVEISMGQGFWYISKSAGSWNWSETNRYQKSLE